MSDAPKLKPWVVALSFQPAPLWMGAVFAATSHEATAAAVFQCMKANAAAGNAMGELASVLPIEQSAEWLRSALRVAEGGAPEGAAVLSLVPTGEAAQGQVAEQRRGEQPNNELPTIDPRMLQQLQRQPIRWIETLTGSVPDWGERGPPKPGEQIIDPQLPPGAA